MKTTPFSEDFKVDTFQLTVDVLVNKFVILSSSPLIETLTLIVDESNDILSDEYVIEEIVEDNYVLYPGSQIGQYILRWSVLDSSSSSGSPFFDLEVLLQTKQGDFIQVRYLLNT